jgi:hypothetical protein
MPGVPHKITKEQPRIFLTGVEMWVLAREDSDGPHSAWPDRYHKTTRMTVWRTGSCDYVPV